MQLGRGNINVKELIKKIGNGKEKGEGCGAFQRKFFLGSELHDHGAIEMTMTTQEIKGNS